MTVYTRKVSGFMMTKGSWQEEMKKLKEILTDLKLEIAPGIAFMNGYDPPYKLFNRRNELWLMKLIH